MSEVDQSYRRKQAYLVLLVFACLGVGIYAGYAPVTVGSILAACGIAFWAASLEPEKKPDEHHHH
jgi:hypothetical protein